MMADWWVINQSSNSSSVSTDANTERGISTVSEAALMLTAYPFPSVWQARVSAWRETGDRSQETGDRRQEAGDRRQLRERHASRESGGRRQLRERHASREAGVRRQETEVRSKAKGRRREGGRQEAVGSR
jgi:hypothetical protein